VGEVVRKLMVCLSFLLMSPLSSASYNESITCDSILKGMAKDKPNSGYYMVNYDYDVKREKKLAWCDVVTGMMRMVDTEAGSLSSYFPSRSSMGEIILSDSTIIFDKDRQLFLGIKKTEGVSFSIPLPVRSKTVMVEGLVQGKVSLRVDRDGDSGHFIAVLKNPKTVGSRAYFLNIPRSGLITLLFESDQKGVKFSRVWQK